MSLGYATSDNDTALTAESFAPIRSDENTYVAKATILGSDYTFTISKRLPSWDCQTQTTNATWDVNVQCGTSSRYIATKCDSFDEAVAIAVGYAEGELSDEQSVIDKMDDCTRHFVKHAHDSGAKVSFQSGMDYIRIVADGASVGCSGEFLIAGYTHASLHGWYCRGNSQRGFKVDVASGFDLAIFEHAAGTCDACGEYFGADNIHVVGFANGACERHLESMRRKLEYPGWCD